MTWALYAEGLEERLLDLHRRVLSGAYRAPPVRRVEIPKPGGGTRPLGVAATEDKIVQKAVTEIILTPIYEPVFLGFSYGFRPGRGAHDALDALAVAIARRKVNWVIDCDIRQFFDSVSRNWLVRFLQHRIGDRRVIRLIVKWLKAGVMVDGGGRTLRRARHKGRSFPPCWRTFTCTMSSTSGSIASGGPRRQGGDAIIVRYADDVVVGFEHQQDAERFLHALGERLGQFDLALHPHKTRLIEFGRNAEANVGREGWVARRRSASWDSRTTVGRPEAGSSGSGASRCEAGEAHSEACHGGSAAAHAPRPPSGRAVAGAGRQWMAELLRRPDQPPVPAKLYPCLDTDVDEGAASAVAAGSLQLATAGSTRGPILADAPGPTPMAKRAVCRQIPEVGAGWFNDQSGSVRGALGNQRSYRDRRHRDGLPSRQACPHRRRRWGVRAARRGRSAG